MGEHVYDLAEPFQAFAVFAAFAGGYRFKVDKSQIVTDDLLQNAEFFVCLCVQSAFAADRGDFVQFVGIFGGDRASLRAISRLFAVCFFSDEHGAVSGKRLHVVGIFFQKFQTILFRRIGIPRDEMATAR